MAKVFTLSEFEKLVGDYNRDNAFILKQKIKWLNIKEPMMRKLPKKSEVEEMPGMSPAKAVMKAVADFATKGPKKKSKKPAKAQKPAKVDDFDNDGD